jgi:hypothetical protein
MTFGRSVRIAVETRLGRVLLKRVEPKYKCSQPTSEPTLLARATSKPLFVAVTILFIPKLNATILSYMRVCGSACIIAH